MLLSPWDRLDRALIRRALSGHSNLLATPVAGERTAAVSVLLVPASRGVEVLMIRRAARAGDPWSQHMALPGGFRNTSDADLLQTALRETREEVAVDLSQDSELLGVLPDVNPAVGNLMVRPFVFARDSRPSIELSSEVAAVAWANLGSIARNEAPAEFELLRGATRHRFPGFRVGENVVWGMTYRVLMDLVERATRAFSEPIPRQE
ncbi:MAG: CoA pyrophosphatase [Myxococcota bacterium]|nr:CoA pyrophosphatase [Myxococcota bacterium]